MAYINKGSSQYCTNSSLQVCIFTDNSTVLPPKLHKAGLEILTASTCNNPPDATATCEIDLSNCRVFNHRVDYSRSVLRWTRQHIQAPCRQTCILKGSSNSPITSRRQFRRFENGCVASSKSTSGSSNAEDKWSVPVAAGQSISLSTITQIKRPYSVVLPRNYAQDDTHRLFINNRTLAILLNHGRTTTN